MTASRMTELTADGPESAEIPMDEGAPGAPGARVLAALFPLLALDVVLILLVLVAVISWPPPTFLWVVAGGVVFAGVFYAARVLPRKIRRARAEREGRAATYAARLDRGPWVWSISGFGTGGMESLRVAAMGGSGGVYADGTDPEPIMWCLDAATGRPVEPTGTAHGRADDRAGWAFEPGEDCDPQLFLTIDRAEHDAHGQWVARIGVLCTDRAAPDRLLIQRLSPSEAEDLRPA